MSGLESKIKRQKRER